MLPWHSVENESRTRPESRSPKWQLVGNEAPSKPDTKGWSPWRKAPGSEIEQRTHIDTHDYAPEGVPEQVPGRVPEQIPEQIFEQPPEQQHDFELDRKQQRENPKRPLERVESTGSVKDRGGLKDESRFGNGGRPQNTIEFESKQPTRIENTPPETRVVFEDEDLYEGVSVDSTVSLFYFLDFLDHACQDLFAL